MFKETTGYENERIRAIIRLFTIIITGIFTVELGIMLILRYILPPLPLYVTSLLNSLLLVILLCPILYFFAFWPILLQIKKQEQTAQELKKANLELKKLDRLKSEFISNVSHEIRTPLTIVKEGVSQVVDGLLGEIREEQREFLKIVLSNVDRLTSIITDLLDISKIESGRLELKIKPVNIVDLFKGAYSIFVSRARDKGLEIKMNFSQGKAIEAYADKDKITQVVNNLLDNAIKFTDKGYIEISVIDRGQDIECLVSDTGRGISEEDLPRVFDKFQQFNRVAGAGKKGTGLGLSIVKGIIELHHGKIWMESKLNTGTRITFRLPKMQANN